MRRSVWFWTLAWLVVLNAGCAPLSPAERLPLQLHAFSNVEFPVRAPLIVGDSHKAYLPQFVGVAKTLGVEVFLVNDMPAWLWGYYDPQMRAIFLNLTLSPNGLVATLLHELGHALQPATLTGDDAQAFAEAVSYLACARIGLDVWRSSFAYLRPPDQARRERIENVLCWHAKAVTAAVDRLVRASAGAASSDQ
jgi:hypothetical protein